MASIKRKAKKIVWKSNDTDYSEKNTIQLFWLLFSWLQSLLASLCVFAYVLACERTNWQPCGVCVHACVRPPASLSVYHDVCVYVYFIRMRKVVEIRTPKKEKRNKQNEPNKYERREKEWNIRPHRIKGSTSASGWKSSFIICLPYK